MSDPFRRMKLHMAATLAPLAMQGGSSYFGVPGDLADERPTHGYYSKGHTRRNWDQKRREGNLKVAKRRAKNKASRKARKKQRR